MTAFAIALIAAAVPVAALATGTQTVELQTRIDALAASGGGTLTLSAGTYRTGALFFKPGVNLHLEKGAEIVGTDDAEGYPMCETRIEGETCIYYPALINADGCDGFTISGEGVIDGHGANTWEEFWTKRAAARKKGGDFRNKDLMRPRVLYVSRSKNVDVSGVTFKNSKFWTTHFYDCEDVTVHDCEILADILKDSRGKELKGPSTDGIDIDKCRRFTVRNVTFSVNDDGVAVKGGKGPWADDYGKRPENGSSTDVLIENCTFRHPTHSALTLGSECPEVSNVTMRGCVMDGCGNMLNLKMRTDTPQHYLNVLVEDCRGKCDTFFCARAWSQYHDAQGRSAEELKSFADGVTLRGNVIEASRVFDVKLDAEVFELANVDLDGNIVNGEKVESPNAAKGQSEAGRCVVTYTFDDGLADQYTIAYPMFRKAGLPATFFIIGSKIGDSRGMRSKAERNTPVMTWEQIRDMSTNGMEIASHGWAHAKYAKMNRDEILADIRRNQVALKEHVGVDCVSFASPFNAKKGADGSNVEALAKEAGILAVRMRQKGAGGKMTAEKMNAFVEAAKKKGEWLVFMIHGILRGYDAWENPEELAKHLAWVKEQKDIEVLSFADAAKASGYR